MANIAGVADHKAANTTTTTIPGLTLERTKSIVLLLVQLFSVLQTGLSIAGVAALPFTTDQVSTAITGVIAVVSSVWSWWRNNNMTGAAVQGQQVVDAVKLAQSTGNAVDMPGEVVPMSEMIEDPDTKTITE
ncbi:hypothetical protein BLI708_08710 [Bifidobacterium imperatoris]|uniref:Holin, SPP1 family n=1 Tax=Bifidobacterium imperatoris TaxID=2020965 RepID=A0A2N5IQG5_9BIFI|nr:phage holin [Bifidobacterium imperatoris]PLS24197.1 holin, SPP1 family [Bifidobacterium imperatoris]QSY57309.1 hypothetical protein BLI708_08710 [Bifidobacterium imperatoris]